MLGQNRVNTEVARFGYCQYVHILAFAACDFAAADASTPCSISWLA